MLLLCGILVFCVLLLLGGITGIHAQSAQAQTDVQMFEWGFSGTQAHSTSLPSCRSFPITVDSLAGHGVPPFYMIAYAVGGAPITSLIGTNPRNLTWMVRHPIGTQLLLGVVDSHGNSGGVDAPLYTVIAGATTQCIPHDDSESTFNITANVTDALTTCEPWGLRIRGGTPPYNLTLAALNASDVTNVTLGPNDSVFTYINRANPGTQMIASVSDLNGRWATGSPTVRTQGSTNVDCPGLVSLASDPDAQPGKQNRTGPQPISHTGIGIVVGATVGAVFLFGLAIYAMRRRRRVRRAQANMTGVSPFRTWPIDWQTSPGIPPPSPAVAKSFLAHQHSHHTLSLSTTAESYLSPVSSPTTSPPVVVQELPPPYGHPWFHEYQLA